MDFTLSPSQVARMENARAFALHELAPTAGVRETEHCISHDVIRALAQHGLLGVNVPRALGGEEAGVVSYALALREIAAADASVAVTMAVTNMVAEVITRFGTEAQRQAHVPKLVRGDYFAGAFALSEPGAGSDAAALSTRAERMPDGRWRVNGHKMWITSGDRAGVVVLWARTEAGTAGAKGISCFLVDGNTSGMTPGKPEEKMGLRASHTVALDFHDVLLPADALLGEEGQGFKIAMAALDGGRIGISAQSVGLAQRALTETVTHIKRVRHSAELAVASASLPPAALADMATQIDAAWLLTLRAAWLKEKGRPFTQEAAMAKVMASEYANEVIRTALRLSGDAGHADESIFSRLFRDVRVTQIYEGTSEIQRVVIGRTVVR